MKYIKLLSVIFIIVGFTECKKSKTDTEKEVKRVENVEKVYNICDSLEEISLQDTGSVSQNEYGRKMEHIMCEKAKLLRDLSNEDRLLVEYDVAKNMLVKVSNDAKIHKKLLADQQFRKKANEKMEKVRDYYSLLIKANLNSDQKKRFNEITKRKIQ